MNGGLYVSPDFVQLDQYLVYMDFLRELPSGDWQQILARSIRQVTLQPRQVLYQQDEALDYVYILLKGSGGSGARGTFRRWTAADLSAPSRSSRGAHALNL